MEGIIVSLIVGAVTGLLGAQIFKGGSIGLWGNIVAGIIGGLISYGIFVRCDLHLGEGYVGYILTSAIGAIVLLALLNIIVRRRTKS